MARKRSNKTDDVGEQQVNAPQSEAEPEATGLEATDEATSEQADAEEVTEAVDFEKQAAEALDRYIRAKAEMENYRKRVQRDFGEIRTNTKLMTASEFLTVFDHFQMAMAHAEQNADFATLKQGMDMILAEFKKAFENLGIAQVDAVGKEFDPNEHEAVAQEHNDDVPEGQVLRQWKSGYRMGERLIRPATVVVSSGPQPAGDTE